MEGIIKNKLVFLNKKKDFILLKKEGKKIKKNNFFIIYRFNKLTHSRFALVFSKQTGKAVQRNQFKRWSRHFLREKQWENGVDLLLGLERKHKDFYKKMNYKTLCSGFETIVQYINF